MSSNKSNTLSFFNDHNRFAPLARYSNREIARLTDRAEKQDNKTLRRALTVLSKTVGHVAPPSTPVEVSLTSNHSLQR